MKKQIITINTAQIPAHCGRAIGRAFYNAYMEFIKDPQNEKMIEKRAEEIREMEKATRLSNENI